MIIKCYSGGKVVRRFEIIQSETLAYNTSSQYGSLCIIARNNNNEVWKDIFRWQGEYSIEFNNLKDILKKG